MAKAVCGLKGPLDINYCLPKFCAAQDLQLNSLRITAELEANIEAALTSVLFLQRGL